MNYQEVSLAANSSAMKDLPIQGGYVYYYEAAVSVVGGSARILLKSRGGNVVPLIPGQGVRLPADVGGWQVCPFKNTQPQIDATLLFGGVAEQFFDNRPANGAIETSSIGSAFGASWGHDTLLGVNGQVQVIDPTSNARGCDVLSLQSYTYGNSPGVFASGLTAPTSLISNPVIAIATATAYVAPSFTYAVFMQNKVRLPANHGIWYRNGGTAEAFALRSVLYTLF